MVQIYEKFAFHFFYHDEAKTEGRKKLNWIRMMIGRKLANIINFFKFIIIIEIKTYIYLIFLINVLS